MLGLGLLYGLGSSVRAWGFGFWRTVIAQVLRLTWPKPTKFAPCTCELKTSEHGALRRCIVLSRGCLATISLHRIA